MGIVGRYRLEYVHTRGCQVVRRPEGKHMISCIADEVNFGDTLGYLLIEDCEPGWCGDDSINVRNCCSPAEKMDWSAVAARLFDDIYRAGDLVEFPSGAPRLQQPGALAAQHADRGRRTDDDGLSRLTVGIHPRRGSALPARNPIRKRRRAQQPLPGKPRAAC